MRVWLFFALTALSCLGYAEDLAGKEKVARSIVTEDKTTFQENVSLISKSESVQIFVSSIIQQEIQNFDFLLSLAIRDLNPQKKKKALDDFQMEFHKRITTGIQRFLDGTSERFIQSYLDSFSHEELVEILRTKPKAISDKHRKFELEVLSVAASLDKYMRYQVMIEKIEVQTKLLRELQKDTEK